MRTISLLAISLIALGAPRGARADGCALSVDATDMMQFTRQQLRVPASCPDIELTLRHTGAATPGGMVHNWVLVRRADLAPVAAAGSQAGREHDFVPPADPRVLAATPAIAGGQRATIRFPTSALKPGERYAFFCSTPGHNVIMRGELRLDAEAVASAGAP